jgi:uncharacterized glyoxalase superfamily protein PhnB
MGQKLWAKEFRLVYYSWEYDSLRSFYKDVLGMEQLYSWYTSPADRGCKVLSGDCRLELISRRPTTPVGLGGLKLRTDRINAYYESLANNPRVNFYEDISDKPWGERSFRLKDPIGNEVEIYQPADSVESAAGPGRSFLTGEFTAKLYAADVEALAAAYKGVLQLEQVSAFDSGPNDKGVRLKAAGGFLEILSRKEKMPKGPLILTMEAADVDAVYHAVKGRSEFELIWDMENTWYGIRMFQVRDSEGNMTEIISYKRNIRKR